jgi:hypothetical protein
MGEIDVSLAVLLFSMLVAIIGVARWVVQSLAQPRVPDPSQPKGSVLGGVYYAFTGGMLPWKKESVRLHWFSYVRGVLFHLGIFTGIVVLLLSLFVDIGNSASAAAFSPTLGLGVVAGILGIVARLTDRNLRALSTLDDYVSVSLVILFLLAALSFVFDAASRAMFYAMTSALCLYVPWSKVRHFVYFFFSRMTFGAMFGRRGVLPAPKTNAWKEGIH